MLDQRLRSYKILACVLAILSGLIAVVIFALYGIRQSLLSDPGVSFTAALLGIITVVYFLAIHPLVARTRLALSTFIITAITALNFLLIIASTGGLDSPYYSLWLLAIIVAGIFGRAQTIGILALTIGYYGYSFIANGLSSHTTYRHLVQLGITIIAGALAEWVHMRDRRTTVAVSNKLDTLSGKLTAEQLKAEAVISSINEGVMVVDGSYRIKLFNRAAQELTGWDEASAQGIDSRLVLQLKTSDDQNLTSLNDPFVHVWKTQTSTMSDNLVLTTRAGRKIQLHLSISPIYDESKSTTDAIALFRDISREKEVERQKDEFVSTASHEMRTPVAAIEGYIALAMNPNVASIDNRAKVYLDKAHDAITHLGELFRDLLGVTKAEEGQLGAQIEPVNLGQMIQTAVDDMQFAATKKNLSLVYQIGAQTGKAIAPLFYVAANSERLREVVLNLIDNAIKFTGEGGIKVTLEGNDKEVVVGVADTGIGIAAEDVNHLFQKFYRIDNSATRTIGGTGLGLYLCRRIIEVFNGRIWVESKRGEGSIFKFSLPRMNETEISKMQEGTIAVSTAPAPTTTSNQAPAAAPQPPAAPATAAASAPAQTSIPATPAPGQAQATQ